MNEPQEDWLEKAMREADGWMKDDPVAVTMRRPSYYHRDGTPFTFDCASDRDETIQWATEFETVNRQVRQNITAYGERLSTVFLGQDHSFGSGPPLIFETMLFAPDPQRMRRKSIISLADAAFGRESDPVIQAEYDKFQADLKKNYPHDQLQLRYSTEAEAIKSHRKLRLQCLVPPRWRRLLCYTIGGDETWN